jgi:subtilase family serine protease
MSRKLFSTPRGIERVSAAAVVMFGLVLSAGAESFPRLSVPRISGPVSQASLVTLKGNTLPVAHAAHDLGRVPDSTPTGRVMLLLKPSADQQAALDRLVADQQSSASPNFHKWLTPTAYAAQFGVADADIQTVTGYLAAQGFNVAQVFPNKMAIEFSGTAGQMRATFKTEIHTYTLNGQKFVANDRDPQIPAALAPVVHGFVSLNNYEPPAKVATAVKRTATLADVLGSKPRPLYTDATNYELNVAPGDFAKIYNIPAASTGTGVTIGVVNTSNVNLTYVENYQTTFGLTVKAPTVIVDGDDPGETSNEADGLTQLELLSAVAPKATLNYYTSASTDASTGINFAVIRAVDDDQIQVLVYDQESCEANLGTTGTAFANAVAEQAAAEGITVIAAAGNGGPDSCESSTGYGNDGATTAAATKGLSVNGYASTPFVTAVGATDFYYGQNATITQAAQYWNLENGDTSYTSALGYIPEQPWNLSDGSYNAYGSDNIVAATGGGVSTLGDSNGGNTAAGPYPEPSWQSGVVPASLFASGTTPARVLPDVAIFGGNGLNGSAYVVCVQADECVGGSPGTLNYELDGGTNASSAAFAGIAALVVQSHGAQGNINPVLYSLYQSGKAPSIFHAPVIGTNAVQCTAGTTNCGSGGYLVDSTGALAYQATTSGYNAAVGLGSVNVTNLIADWKSPATIPTTTTFTLTTPGTATPIMTFVHGTSVQGNIAVMSSTGTPTGDVSITSSTPLSNNTGVTYFTLAGGSYTDTELLSGLLPGGTYSLTAKYAGNGEYESSVSTPFTITVTREASTIVVEQPGSFVSGSTVAYGSSITLVLAVTSATNLGSIAQPTGAVNVLDNGVSLTSIPIDDIGVATFTAALGAGYHSLTFTYAGDASYTSSSLTTGVLVGVNSQSTTTTLSATSTDDASNGYVQLVAVVNSTAGAKTGVPPTGTVAFETLGSTTKTIGTVKLVPGTGSGGSIAGIANFQMPGSKLSSTEPYVAAVFTPASGSGYSSSISNILSLSRAAASGTTASTTTIATSDGASAYFDYDGSVSFNVTVSGTGKTPGGSVTLFANGMQISAATALSGGKATVTIAQNANTGLLPLPLGDNIIIAQYSGDATTNYATSTGAVQITVLDEGALPDFSMLTNLTYGTVTSSSKTAPAFTLMLTSINNFAAFGQAIKFTYTAPTGITCTFGSTSAKFVTTSVYLGNTVTCGAASGYSVAAATPAEAPLHRSWIATGGAVFACVFLIGMPRARQKQWRSLTGAIVLLVLTLGISAELTGCGSSNNLASGASSQAATNGGVNSDGTTAASKILAVGTYQVLVTATASFATGTQTGTSSTQVHTLPLQILVQ